MNKFNLGNIVFSNKSNFVLIGGVNVLESKDFIVAYARIYVKVRNSINF